jgi:hypothetical protein
MIYKTENLIEAMRSNALIYISDKTFTEAQLITFLNEELQLALTGELVAKMEDFFLDSETRALTASVSRYELPKRSKDDTLKGVLFVNADGDKRRLTRGSFDDLADTSTAEEPEKFVVAGSDLILVPVPTLSTGSLELWYHGGPSDLVATTACAKITGVTSVSGSTTFEVDTDLTAAFQVGDELDLLNAQSPFKLWAKDVAITGITTSTVVVATSDVIDQAGTVRAAVGDYLCPTEEANIPMIPERLHPILPLRAVRRMLIALGDTDKLQLIDKDIQEKHGYAFKTHPNRVESELNRVVKRNGFLSHSGYGR